MPCFAIIKPKMILPSKHASLLTGKGSSNGCAKVVLEMTDIFFCGAIHWRADAKLAPSSVYVLFGQPVLEERE